MTQLCIPRPILDSLFFEASQALSSGFLTGLRESGIFLFSQEKNRWKLTGFMKIPFKEGEDKTVLARQLFGDDSVIALADYDHITEGPLSEKMTFFFYVPPQPL